MSTTALPLACTWDLRLQFGFARQITVGQAGKRAARGADPSAALAPEPAPKIADDTPLALGQVRRVGRCWVAFNVLRFWCAVAAAVPAGAHCCIQLLLPPPLPLRLPLLLQREDLRALAVVLLECILSALALNGPSQLTSAESIQVGAWQPSSCLPQVLPVA